MTFHFLWNEINTRWKWTQSDDRTFINNAMVLFTKLPAIKKKLLMTSSCVCVVTSIFSAILFFSPLVIWRENRWKTMSTILLPSSLVVVVQSIYDDSYFLSKVDSIRMFAVVQSFLNFNHSKIQRVKTCVQNQNKLFAFKYLVPLIAWQMTTICAQCS